MRVVAQEECDELQPTDLKYINSMPEKIQELKNTVDRCEHQIK
jgi:hypothetical protein